MKLYSLLVVLFLYVSLGATDGFWTKDARTCIQEKGKSLKIGIMCAHPNELGAFVDKMEAPHIHEQGMRKFIQGRLYGIDSVVVVSRVGKVAASSTAAHLITQYNVDMIILTGVAGAADESLSMGDCVIASGLIQHDMDSSPIIPQYHIPFLRIKTFCPDQFLQERASLAATKFLQEQLKTVVDADTLADLKVVNPKVVRGCIASGDKFFADKLELSRLKQKLPETICVEMEGAAVAQVCYEYGIPCAVIRIISDLAVQNADVDCLRFMKQVAHIYSENIVKNLYLNAFVL